MPRLMKGWKLPNGVCPACFNDVEAVAIRNIGGWQIMARCYCRHINDAWPWPFEDGILEADANDLQRLGITVEIGEDVEDMFEIDIEAYMEEVDYGWEDSYD